jgi:hypothetical protein
MTDAELAHRRDRFWLVAIRGARLRELARREQAVARWHMRRAQRLVARGVPAKRATGGRSIVPLATTLRGR